MRYKDKKPIERQKKAYNYLISNGLSKQASAAILGNLRQESGHYLDSSVQNSIGAFGIAQWLGQRKKDLIAYAKQKGTEPTDFDTQLEYLVKEIKTTGNSWLSKEKRDAFLNADTLEEATDLFVRHFERSGEKPGDRGYDNRIKYAKQTFNAFNTYGQVYDIDENNNVVSVNPSTATEAQKKTSDAVRKSMLSPKSERIINEVKFQQAFYKNYSTIDNVNSQVQKQQEQEEKTTNKTQQKEETETTSQQPQFNPFSQQQTEQQKQYVAPQQEIDYTLLAPEENEFMSQFLAQFQKGGEKTQTYISRK